MDKQPVQESQQNIQTNIFKAAALCVAGILIPGLGHALQRKWMRAAIFFLSISIMVLIGLQLKGRLCGPGYEDIFSALKFIAEAGAGLLYWIPLLTGFGTGAPEAYTFDYANLFLYVAGLLNMLVVIDVFDIALGRKQ
jgi:hypothetical protein